MTVVSNSSSNSQQEKCIYQNVALFLKIFFKRITKTKIPNSACKVVRTYSTFMNLLFIHLPHENVIVYMSHEWRNLCRM